MCCNNSVCSRLRAWILTHRPRWSDINLSEDVTLFSQSQWPLPQPAFVAYRAFVAIYTLAWLIMSIVNAGVTTSLGGFFVFLTNWTYITLSLYLIFAFVSTAYTSYVRKAEAPDVNRNKPDGDVERQMDVNVNVCTPTSDSQTLPQERPKPRATPNQLPLYFKVTWVLLNVCLAFGPIISVVYWAFIFDPEFVYTNQGGGYGVALTVHRHAFNTIFVYFDLAISAMPIRFWHFVHPCAYGFLYVFFSLVYYWAGGINPYFDHPAIYPKLLDWTTPGRTCLILVAMVFVLILFHSLSFGSYKLRMYLAGRFLARPSGHQYSRTLRIENSAHDEKQATDHV